MSDTNGHDANAEGMSRILSLKDAKPKHALTRAQRAEVERLAYDMVIQECAKVHEHYLTQLPHFVARMIQDALMSYGLIVPQPGTDIAPAAAPVVSENAGGDTAPSDSITPVDDDHGADLLRYGQDNPVPDFEADALSAGNLPTDSEGPEAA